MTYNDLQKSELGSKMLKAQDRSNQITMPTSTNEIGLSKIIEWNPFKLQEKNPFAVVIAEAFDKMLQETIPQDAVISTRFSNWIAREKNELMVDSKINKDAYFKENIDKETGEVTNNYGSELISKKLEYLEKSIANTAKAFKTHMQKNPEVAFANEEELKKWKEYYSIQAQKINTFLENQDFSNYDKKDKEGNTVKQGTEEDAMTHKGNVDSLLNKVDNKLTEMKVSKEEIPEYVNEESFKHYNSNSNRK
ncbi:hypothetical protein ACMC3V_001800 [Campylobacter coli]|nr:hypothetical protein [Campylobacter coli]HEB8436992.1 hypothetical protein [Campylobacter jejuni]EAL2352325.1 hypothetical protein [Campylobacter coli]EAL4304977.1 hypothetical protein [Campylobacter coli]ECB9809305.1 hypothetical protein [Campylobacter coli]ECK7527318.1 hypothetical protein [Campylobacter coli]